MSNPPFCVDCTHRLRLLGSDMCNRTTDRLDLTTGRSKVLYKLCTLERMWDSNLSGLQCSPSGRFFQQNTSVWYRIKKWVSSKFSPSE